MVEVFLQARRDGAAAKRLFKRLIRKLKSVGQAQQFLGAHAAVYNLFNLGRQLVRAQHYRDLRISVLAKQGVA